MPDMGKWNGHVFTIKPDVLRLFKDLTIKGSSEYEYKKQMGTSYVLRKNAAPREVDFTVLLDKRFGVDVRQESLDFVKEAYKGKKAYLYIGGKKLIPSKLMLTSADVDSIEIAPNGQWLYAECKLALKQASKGSDADKEKKKKKSAKRGNPTKKPAPTKPNPNLTWLDKLKNEIDKKKRNAKLRLNAKKPSGNKAPDPNKKDKYIVLRR